MKRRDLGLTLLELLTVIAIISILLAILLSAFGRSRTQAKATVDIAQLHQLGLAASMYTEDLGGNPYSVAVLGHTDYASSNIYASPNDPSPSGLLNEFLAKVKTDMERLAPWDKTLWMKVPLPYKASYVGIGDIHMRYYLIEEKLQKLSNAGWAICVIEHKSGQKFPYYRPPYTYLRLHMDSSVKQYRSAYRMTQDGRVTDMIDLFGEQRSDSK
jgi:prepilin-type N-terminal cleavage/methylation domain-containing protein